MIGFIRLNYPLHGIVIETFIALDHEPSGAYAVKLNQGTVTEGYGLV
jgi:hypothetical protein